MKLKNLRNWAFVSLMACATFSCTDEDPAATPETGSYTLTEQNGITWLEGTVDQNLTLSASKKYMLKDFVYVKAPATLTIEPGTIIMGDQTTNASLIVEQGAKIMAEGTAAKPIVFTSAKAKGSRSAGNWGGLIILGKAPVNLGANAKIEGGVDRPYGGTEVNDNSGVLKYVRIEYSGIAFQPDNEINGLTLGGVGAGTTIDYVQVSFNGDDAFEFFGGTVNAKHLIAYKTVDDMFDTDNGFSGNLQFLVGLSNPSVADASSSNGFESDGDAQGSDASPKTAAVFSNVSLFGPLATPTTSANSLFKRALHVRRNSSISVYNSVFAGWPEGLLLDGSKSQANATTGALRMKNVVIAGTPAGKELKAESGSTFDVAAWFNNPSHGNAVVADNASLHIANAFSQTAPDFRPGTGSSLLSGASFTGLDAFFTHVAYKGAFGSEDWTAGWTNWNPQQTDY
ncbi:MAG: T9SS C-terminal target domain-containing protein [Adhaeribacter sp.]